MSTPTPDVDRLRTEYVQAIQARKRAERFGGATFVPDPKFSHQLAEARRNEAEALRRLEEAEGS